MELLEEQNVDNWICQNITIKTEDGQMIPTNAAGTLVFKGVPKTTRSLFVRLTSQTSHRVACELLTDIWDVKHPKILISMVSGATGSRLPKPIAKCFKKGLLKVASTPGAWVITCGLHTRMTKYVGSIIKRTKTPCIGISTWSSVKNREVLEVNTSVGEMIGGDFPYDVRRTAAGKENFLDHNNSHFLFVDDTDHRAPHQQYRIDFEDHLSSKGYVPSIILMVNGDEAALQHVYKSLQKKRPTSVVLIKGSMGFADVLAYAIEVSCSAEHLPEHVIKRQIEKCVTPKEKDHKISESECQEIYEIVLECLKYRSYITIYDSSKELDFSDVVFSKLLKTCVCELKGFKNDCLFGNLKLAILWDQATLAEEILDETITYFTEQQLHDAMVMSLAWNRYKIVEVLTQFDISMDGLITVEIMEVLYCCAAVMSKYSPLNELLKTSICDQQSLTSDHWAILVRLEMKHLSSVRIYRRDDICKFYSSICEDISICPMKLFEVQEGICLN